MWKAILVYAILLALGAFALEWLHYQYVTKVFAPEIYGGLIAAAFLVLGIWAGTRLVPRRASSGFERNLAALKSLGVTEREVAVLDLLAAGQSNKEIARSLGVSPNTVKTHVLHLFEKLEVARRTQAIAKARELRLVR
jgi:DNA-binding NarL/FixJ family response regulator